MENNRYYQNRKEINRISIEQNVDIGVACAMLRDMMKWEFKDGKDTEITEFTAYVQSIPAEERKAFFEN